MAKLEIIFEYGVDDNTTKESIIANIEANENGDYELKTILKKIKSYGYAKSKIQDLQVYYYRQFISTGPIELV